MTSAFDNTPKGQSAAIVLEEKQKGLKRLLTSEAFKKQIGEIAGKFMTPEAMIRLTLVATSRQPKLLECTPESILRCLMDAAVLKVRPGGIMGRGYLIPRWNNKIKKNEACFDPGYRGLADVARRSGQIKRISAGVVREKDECEFIQGTEEKIVHRMHMRGDRGDIVFAYAVAEFKDGGTQLEIIPKSDIEKIMAVSMSKDRDTGNPVGPWRDWEDEMCKKTATRRLCKWLPYDDDLEKAITLATKSDSADVGDFDLDHSAITTDGEVVDAAALPPKTTDEKLSEQLNKTSQAQPVAAKGREPGVNAKGEPV